MNTVHKFTTCLAGTDSGMSDLAIGLIFGFVAAFFICALVSWAFGEHRG